MEKCIRLSLVAVMLFMLGASCLAATSTGADYQELKIGMSGVMTGPAAAWSLPSYQALVMRVEEINAAGGLTIGEKKYMIKVYAEDNKFEVPAAITAMEKLVYRDKVHVMYTYGGPPILATQEKLEKIPMLHFIMGWDVKFRDPKYPYTYSPGMSPADFAKEFLEWAKKAYPVRTLKVLGENTQGGWQNDEPARKAAAAAGFEVLPSEFYEPGTSDFYSLISRLEAAKVDAVLCVQVPPRATGLLLKQRDELGSKLLVIHWAGNPEETMKIAGKACENNFVMRHTDFSATPKLKAFDESYRKRWNESPMLFSQEGYDFVGIYAKAVEKAGKIDLQSVKAALDDPAFVYEGLMGTYRWGGKSLYGRNVDMYYPIGVAVIKEGKVKNVAIIPIAPK